MKKGKSILILAGLLVILLGGGAFAYQTLSKNTTAESVPEVSPMPETFKNTENSEISESESISNVQSAPDFTFLNAEGEEVRIADLTGKPILINFWATWCPPCKAELPYFEKAYTEYGEEIQFLMMNVTDGVRDTVDSAKQFQEENGYQFPLYFDTKGEGAKAYTLMSIPLTVFINAEGELTYQHIGAMTEEDLFSMLERQLNP